ncbi:hypothetical protein ACTHPH_21720 [Paenibacillus pasadenensis]|uniref:hypothetical protein n=1 Tax=Paenibacillus pasadenensis TaxID=217090 RepID=UPI00040FE699|nr:hypothetical protein [Paenibacillus pasadenensis]
MNNLWATISTHAAYLTASPSTKLFEWAKTEAQSLFGLFVLVMGVILMAKKQLSVLFQWVIIMAGAAIFIFAPKGMGEYFKNLMAGIFGINLS